MVFILHEWIDHEGLSFYGVFSTLEKACIQGKKIQNKGFDPMIAEVALDDLDYVNKGGEYAFKVLHTVDAIK